MARTECPSCHARVLVLTNEKVPDEVLVVDAWPSVHGFVERTSVANDTARMLPERKPGTYRLHVETCGRA